jgi:isopenicillin N synthase-like dioxygenase
VTALPVVDLRDDAASAQLDRACKEVGFFYVVGHGVDPSLGERLEATAQRFFALPEDEKAEVSMAAGGRAWRGWFPLGGELTSGVPDGKEGYYFGAEDPPTTLPLHGPNVWPAAVPELRDVVLEWLDVMGALGARLSRLLGVPAALVAQPTVLFRIFRYPPTASAPGEWGVAEHTDYGLLTILRQDEVGGLEVRLPSTGDWITAPPIEDAFVCNVGDVLERLSGGRWRSTPHRVRNTSDDERLSFPYFFDPSWDAPIPEVGGSPVARWDGQDLYAVRGSYGDYLLSKVVKVFPDLGGSVLE